MSRIVLSIGSNIEPERYLVKCAKAINANFIHPVWSPVYRSAAIGMEGDDFLNAVVMAQTNLAIDSVSQLLREIEDSNGRVRTENKFSSRTLDIDLLLYDQVKLQTPALTLPRPEITTAAHVLKPLADLLPGDAHPSIGHSYEQLLAELQDSDPSAVEALSAVSLSL